MMTRKQISKTFGITEAYICMLLNKDPKKRRLVSWPLAARLSELFPGRTIQQWKAASPSELKRAFEQLNIKEVA